VDGSVICREPKRTAAGWQSLLLAIGTQAVGQCPDLKTRKCPKGEGD